MEQLELKWNSTDIPPPDQKVMVKDAFGNQAYAEPCYYRFKSAQEAGEGNQELKYWDGSWIIQADSSFNNPIKGGVVQWALI